MRTCQVMERSVGKRDTEHERIDIAPPESDIGGDGRGPRPSPPMSDSGGAMSIRSCSVSRLPTDLSITWHVLIEWRTVKTRRRRPEERDRRRLPRGGSVYPSSGISEAARSHACLSPCQWSRFD